MSAWYWGIGDGAILRSVNDPSTPEFIREFAAEQQAKVYADAQFLKDCGIAPLQTIEIKATA